MPGGDGLAMHAFLLVLGLLFVALAAGFCQAGEVERRLGWEKRGRLSLIERGVPPSPQQAEELRRFYAELLLK